MYYGMLRISEVASGSEGSHPVLARDIHIGNNKNKILFLLRTSKTHWQGSKPQMVKISSTEPKSSKHYKSLTFCPFDLLRKFAIRWGPYKTDDEPFFIFADGSPILQKHVRTCLRTILKESGFNPLVYGLHSLRTG